ncbi:MAG TPA: hypothetical protein VFK02_29390 [Kofleriaceae bacterium]|nr:hypothetical protein [Kofleriaceae bacterium]
MPDAYAGGGWVNEPITEQGTAFHIVFALVPGEPSGAPIDAVVGLSDGPADFFTDLGPIVRFSPAGTLDVRNGSIYSADVSVPYRIGQTYQVRMDVDLARHRYSVLVEENGGHTTQIANGYAFRTEQASVTRLNHIGRFIDSPTGTLHQIAYDLTTD